MRLRVEICHRGHRFLLPFSFMIFATAGLGTAAAQTVIVRSAQAAATIEVTFNGGAPVTGTADSSGDATLTIPTRISEAAVLVHLDDCGNRVRVLLVEAGIQPATPEPGCNRVDIPSVFVMRPVTTFVIDMEGAATTVHLTQGPPPASWVQREEAAIGHKWGTATRGLVVSAAAGISSFSNAVSAACGDVQSCKRTNFGSAVAVSAGYWINRYVGAEASYLQPADVDVSGSGDTFQFDSRLATRLAAVVGKAGAPVGPTRLYGFGGMNRHESTLTTTETISGATQTFARKTTGWNWVAGGGIEAWINRFIAIYTELTLASVKGSPTAGGEGGIDDRATFLVGGVRVRFGL